MLIRAGWLGGAGCAALALAGALFLYREPRARPTEKPLRVCLVDVSASVARAPDWLGWARGALREEARVAQAEGQDLLVASYGAGVAVGVHAAPAREFLARLDGGRETPFDPRRSVGDGATELGAAVALAEGVLLDPRRPPGTLVLLGDGSYTGEEPTAALARLEQGGHGLCVRVPDVHPGADLGVVELELPPRVEVGAPLVARATLTFTPGASSAGRAAPTRARVMLEVRNGPSLQTLEQELELPLLPGPFEWPIDCGAAGFGRTDVAMRVALEGGPDPVPENDRAHAASAAEGARVVAVVAAEEALDAARRWLAPAGRSAWAGLELFFVPLGSEHEALTTCDALLTYDVPLSELSAPLVTALVRGGGGWLATSGSRFLRDWTPGRPGPLHELLPLAPSEVEHGARDVVLLVDGSGSMEGQPFETVRGAALDLVGAALPEDRVVLRFFTTRLERETCLKERGAQAGDGGAREAARELLGVRVPSGSTYLLRSIEQLIAVMGPHETLAFLLSDGRERDALPDPLALAADVRARFALHSGRLVVVAVGDADRELLDRLAGGPERVWRGETLAQLSEVFQRELLGTRLVTGEALAVQSAVRPRDSLAAQVMGPGNGADEVLLSLQRYVRDVLRPGAEALWRSEEGDPLLAVGRIGLGRTALFASRPSPDWAAGWSGRPGADEPREFAALVRWLARRPRDAGGPSVRAEGSDLWITELAVETPARLDLRVLAAEDGLELGRLEALPPAGLGLDQLRTRVVPLPAAWRGRELVVQLGSELDASTCFVRAAPAPEFAAGEARLPSAALSARPARAERPAWSDPAGARAPAAGRGPGGRGHPAAPWSLAVGLLGLLAGALGSRIQGIKGLGESTDRRATGKEAPTPRP